VTPEAKIIPFDTYNLFYRDGLPLAHLRTAARSMREPLHV
jgi:hypothetical protein